MVDQAPIVTIVEDDDSVRRSLARLLRASGYSVRTFSSASAFLGAMPPTPQTTGCLLVDVRLPGVDGLELQAILNCAGADTAIVFMTGHGDVQTGVKAMKSGAVDFLLKPFTDEALLRAVQRALVRDADDASRSERG